MIIDVLDVFLRRHHVVILQRLPPLLCVIVCGVEDDAVRVQMRVERTRGIVLEKSGDDVAREPVGVCTALT